MHLKPLYLLSQVLSGNVLVRRNIDLVSLFQLAVRAIRQHLEGESIPATQRFAISVVNHLRIVQKNGLSRVTSKCC
jgi:hypothetical protein